MKIKRMKNEVDKIKNCATEVRKSIIEIVTKAKASHIGGSLSSVDILAALYFKILSINPKNPADPNRDRFIMSKGHCCSALYATLAHKGFFSKNKLNKYCSDGGSMWGHATLNSVPGVDATTGSLGHGLSIGVGMSIALKRNNKKSRVFVLLSDGECDEGSIWEAALSAHQFKLDNLVAIIDYNKIQAFGRVEDVIELEPFADKWSSFGWSVKEIDGHNIKQIIETLEKVPFETDRPSVIIAHTIKGKGVSFMEDKLEWHYKSPNPDEYKIAMKELQNVK